MARPLVLALCAWLVTAVAGAQAPLVTAVEIRSPHRLPEERVRAAIGELAGKPRLRGAVRDSLERLWALGLFGEARVEEIAEPGGVRLRYVLSRRPYVADVQFRGDLELDEGELAAAVQLPRGATAEPAALEQARGRLLELYHREGFVAARVAVTGTTDPDTNARAVVFAIEAGPRARVGDVHVIGTRRLATEFVARAFGVEAGDRFREAAVREGVAAVERRYRERGFFEARVDARRTIDREQARVALAVAVEEGPHTRIEFEGAQALDERRLRERLTFADTRIVDATEVRASAGQVAALYREHGHAFVEVEGRLLPGPDRVVRVTVVEGPRVQVEAVDFPGSPLPEERLREAVSTRPRGLFSRGLFQRDVATRDAQALAAFLRARGHPDATVAEPRVAFSRDRTRARVTFVIEPGPRVTVGRVDVVGDTVFAPGELGKDLPLRSGEPWTVQAARDGRRLLERRYARRGYLAADVVLVTERRQQVVDVTYRVTPGQQTRIGRILVGGLVQTRERVVRRELPFRPGDPFDPEAMVEAQRKLGDVAAFERVDVEPLRPAPAPFADVIVTVKERKPWHLDFGAGYTTFEGARVFVELGHDNVLGLGHSLTVRQRVSERGDRSDLVYGVPWLLGTRWRGDGTVFRERAEEIGFELERFGVAVGVQRPLLEEEIRGLHGALRYELSEVDRFDVDPTLAAADVVAGRQRIATLTPLLTLDRRDAPLDPRRGSFHLLGARTGSRLLGGDTDFLKGQLETHWFLDLLPPTVLALSARLGLATALAGDESLPIEERFFAGGATTVRGYRERRLGPLDATGNPTGGNGLAVLNAEWRFPIWRWFGGTLFVDTGAVTTEAADLGVDDFRSGVGGGLRVSTPVGPMRVDVGYPLDRIEGEEDRELQLYFSIGHPF
jgi:outer membrane protein insertion porin family